MKGFGSDNHSGVHPKIMDALLKVNIEHVVAYGADSYTAEAETLLKTIFGENTQSFFVFTGTAANVLGITANTQSYQAVICPTTAHINTDECGAPERYSGCKLLTVPSYKGKLSPNDILIHLSAFGSCHHSQPAIVSISQATELGTVYTIEEIRAIAEVAHQNKMLLHVDGARLANAAASLNCGLADCTTLAGADIVSFGGTKNGLMYGETIVFTKPEVAEYFPYLRKQAMQLASKMRYISAQFITYLSDELWRNNALHANKMALLLSERLKAFPQIELTQKTEANGVFAIFPQSITPKLQEKFCFYVWDEMNNEVRLMTSWDTNEQDIDAFIHEVEKALSNN